MATALGSHQSTGDPELLPAESEHISAPDRVSAGLRGMTLGSSEPSAEALSNEDASNQADSSGEDDSSEMDSDGDDSETESEADSSEEDESDEEDSSERDSDETDSEETDSDSTSSAEQESPLLDWYARLPSRRVDIVGDFAGNELFLIEGDSMLRHCFGDLLLDFNHGFQVLHASYLVEKFLRNLASRRCNYHIAFFDEHQELSVLDNAAKYLLARAIIIRHLQVNLRKTHPDIAVNVFSSFDSDDFQDYLRQADIYFVMCHDGAMDGAFNANYIHGMHGYAVAYEGYSNDRNDFDALSVQKHVKTFFRGLIYQCICRGFSVALINGLQFVDSKVITIILEASPPCLEDEAVDPVQYFPEDDAKQEFDVTGAIRTSKSLKHRGLTEREHLTLLVIQRMTALDECSPDMASALLLHTALLSACPLSNRTFSKEFFNFSRYHVNGLSLRRSAPKFITRFAKEARVFLESEAWDQTMDDNSASCDVYDLIDGNLFMACLAVRCTKPVPRFQMLVNIANSMCSLHVSFAFEPPFQRDWEKPLKKKKTKGNAEPQAIARAKKWAVLPFKNAVFDAHLAPVRLEVEDNADGTGGFPHRIFKELSHWHSSKKPLDSKARAARAAQAQKSSFFARRRNQRYMAEMTAYAGSLTNAVGKVLEPETVVSKGKGKSSAPKKEINPTAQKAPKNAKKGGRQAIMEEQAAINSRKDAVAAEALFQGWKTRCAEIESSTSLAQKYEKAKGFYATLMIDNKKKPLRAEVQLYIVNLILQQWLKYCRADRKNEGLPQVALIYEATAYLSKLSVGITKTIVSSVKAAVTALGLNSVAMPTPMGDRKLAFSFVLSTPPAVDLSIAMSPQRFQLLHCGPYLARSFDAAPDNRVGFEPDGWQRKVLDEIDAKHSLLVVAPTSAGKTFISFYAMKQVLESGDDDVLVYVAPTKALVNQIAAEVQARYSKKFSHAGKSVWAIHTRDYRINNPTGCQVLVTVPHILQIMLLAPSNANSWSKRVKYIVLDEVHCIGQEDDGVVWEQLLLLAPCPIIALSATIGNTQEFSAWLGTTQKALGHEFTLIQHPHRYTDLRKFVYVGPEDAGDFNGLPERRPFAQVGLDDADDFEFVHPVASLVNKFRVIPDDFSLEARDCLMLWESMSKHQTTQYPLNPALDPARCLPEEVRRTDIIKWASQLMKVFGEWHSNKESPVAKVVEDLSGHLQDLISETSSARDDLFETALPLLASLQKQDALPCIMFSYDRYICENMCRAVFKRLQNAETHWKSTSSAWKNKLKAWEEWKITQAKAEKRGSLKPAKKGHSDERLSKIDLTRESASAETSQWASFDPDSPVDGFHFKNTKKCSKEEMDEFAKQLAHRDVPRWLIDALDRGVCFWFTKIALSAF